MQCSMCDREVSGDYADWKSVGHGSMEGEGKDYMLCSLDCLGKFHLARFLRMINNKYADWKEKGFACSVELTGGECHVTLDFHPKEG